MNDSINSSVDMESLYTDTDKNYCSQSDLLKGVRSKVGRMLWHPHKLKQEFVASGTTIHSGKKVNIRVIPAKEGTGIVFIRDDLNISTKLTLSSVTSKSYATSILFKGNHEIRMIEHCLSALSACGITNCEIHVDGDEMPIFDGSSSQYLSHICNAGISPIDKANVLLITKEFSFKHNNSTYRFIPASTPQVCVDISYPHPCIDKQSIELKLSYQSYYDNIASARTFGFLEDKQKMQEQGLGSGVTLMNSVIYDKNNVLNKEGLRFEDECVRHKCLDLLGDMYTSGNQIIGRIEVSYPGHRGNVQAINAMIDQGDVAELCSFSF